MRFARVVFNIAGIWGVLLLALIFINPAMAAADEAAGAFAQFFYGFLAVTMAWQIAFLIIATDPVRFRPLMPAAILEKAGYIFLLLWLYSRGTIGVNEASSVIPDAVLGVLFVLAYHKTAR